MSNGPARLSVWVGDKVVCIKIAGRASFHGSVDFKALVTGLWQAGHNRFVLDVSECQLMDSTFLGVLAGLGIKLTAGMDPARLATIQLLNPSPRIIDLLDNLGIAHLFGVVAGPVPAIEKLDPLQPAPSQADRVEISRTCLEAHKLLMEINPANVAKFKDVTRFLEEDLKKLEK